MWGKISRVSHHSTPPTAKLSRRVARKPSICSQKNYKQQQNLSSSGSDNKRMCHKKFLWVEKTSGVFTAVLIMWSNFHPLTLKMKPVIDFEECLRDSPKFRWELVSSNSSLEFPLGRDVMFFLTDSLLFYSYVLRVRVVLKSDGDDWWFIELFSDLI